MGYTKKWIPPTTPLRDDLAAWKTLFQDLHDNLILAGLVQTATPGQLDISAVSVLPADYAFEGFIEYGFDDALQSTAPVVIKLEFGCGSEGLYQGQSSFQRSRTPRVRSTVYFGGAVVHQTQHPQGQSAASPNITTQLTTPGTSALCYAPADGFFGVVYGAGSRNVPAASPSGAYIGATLCLFIQRGLDASGAPTSGSLSLYTHGLRNQTISTDAATTAVLPTAESVHTILAAPSVTRTDMAPRVGLSGFSSSPDEVLLEPIYYPSSPAKPFPYLVSYLGTDIATGTEFDFQPLVGPVRNFVALGHNNMGIAPDTTDNIFSGIAMLFE